MGFPGRNNSQANKSCCTKDNAKVSQMIKERAYYIWESKGKPKGQDVTIWLQAEKDICSKMKK